MIAYRVHCDFLKSGDIIPPSTSFFSVLSPEKKRTEEFLEQYRPSGIIPRREAVFLFQDLIDAKKWASRTGRSLYAAELEESDISHCGDWCWLQLIAGGLDTNASDVAVQATNYWNRQTTAHPVWELLARNARVASEVQIPIQERLLLRTNILGLPSLLPVSATPTSGDNDNQVT